MCVCTELCKGRTVRPDKTRAGDGWGWGSFFPKKTTVISNPERVVPPECMVPGYGGATDALPILSSFPLALLEHPGVWSRVYTRLLEPLE